MSARTVVVAFSCALACVACAGPEPLPFYRSNQLTPEWLPASDADAASMHHVAPFRMVDQNGTTVTAGILAGRVTIVNFFFSACGDICPTTMANIRRTVADMSDEAQLQVLSFSVRPERDSVTVLRHFAEQHEISDARWHLLTGDRADTEQLARASFFTALGDGRNFGVDSIAHTERVMLVDGRGRLRGVYAGMLPIEMDRLEEDLKVLVATQRASTRAAH